MRLIREQQVDVAVLDGIKNPEEVAVLRRMADLFVVAVEASKETCWKRVQGRLGSRDKYDRITSTDRREVDNWGLPVQHGQQTDRCVDLADAVIWNDKAVQDGADERRVQEQMGTIAQLEQKVERVYRHIFQPGEQAPNLNEVRMAQAHVVAQRSSCPQRKVGAVITNALGFVVAEGYNAVPGDGPSCMEKYRGCYRRVVKAQDLRILSRLFKCGECGSELGDDLTCMNSACGVRYETRLPPRKNLDYCRAVHAEESAILQVSRFGGIGIDDGTLYTTTYPCALCAKKVLHTGLSKIVFMRQYEMDSADDPLRGEGVVMEQFEGITPRAYHRAFQSADE